MASKSKRKPFEMRPVKIQKNPLPHAEGSALITVGKTKVLCAATVEAGRPRWMNSSDPRGWITAEYNLLPRSTATRTPRERGRVSGRTQEIQRLIGRALRAVADLELLANHTIILDCDVIQADGGTRTAAITGAYVALHQACQKLLREKAVPAFPLFDQVAAVSCGIYQGELWLDLDYEKDVNAEVDMNVVMTGSGKLCEVQGTAEGKPFSRRELERMLALAAQGIAQLIELQKKVLGLA